MRKSILYIVSLVASCFCWSALAASVDVPIYAVAATGQGAAVGKVTLTDSKYGLLITPDLHGLTAGIHGFHVHQNPNCGDNGAAAGGHFDPDHTNKHLGPYNADGHLGDLPALTVDQQGNVTLPVLAPRLKVATVVGHSLMIHEGSDNYSDNPPMGGGGARMYCGVVK
jgi:Cu-Zn family superoxide dismutase